MTEDIKPRVIASMSQIAYCNPDNLKTRIIVTPVAPRYPEGDPDHDPTPVYHIAVVLEEEYR